MPISLSSQVGHRGEARVVTELAARPVSPEDGAALSTLALRSKAHWGYDETFLSQVRHELTWSAADLEISRLVGELLEDRGRCVGFYLLDRRNHSEPELDAMFVCPAWIGIGVGRRLMQMATRFARSTGAFSLLIQADPNAEGFYRAMGANPVGERPSASIPGRSLPLLRALL